MKFKTVYLLLALALLSGCPQSTTSPQPTSSASAVTQTVQAPTPIHFLGDLKGGEVGLAPDHKGNPEKAFAFSGDKGITTPFNINPEALPQCTLVTWARYNSEPGAVQQVFSHDDGGFDRSMGLDDRAGQWGWSCFAGNQSVLGGFPVTAGEWTFLAVAYDANNSTVSFYAGDQKVQVSEARLGTGLEATSLGTNPSYGEFFHGDVEPVMVFDRVLTDAEIDALRKL